jgi:hypothetical protein
MYHEIKRLNLQGSSSKNVAEDDVIAIHLPRGLLALFAASEDCLRFFETALSTRFRLRRTMMGSRVLFA